MFRSNMFELADRLVGIYKTENCTKSVTLNPHLLEETVAPPSQPNLTVIQPSPAKTVSRLVLASNFPQNLNFLVRSSSQSSLHPLGESNHTTMEIV